MRCCASCQLESQAWSNLKCAVHRTLVVWWPRQCFDKRLDEDPRRYKRGIELYGQDIERLNIIRITLHGIDTIESSTNIESHTAPQMGFGPFEWQTLCDCGVD